MVQREKTTFISSDKLYLIINDKDWVYKVVGNIFRMTNINRE